LFVVKDDDDVEWLVHMFLIQHNILGHIHEYFTGAPVKKAPTGIVPPFVGISILLSGQ
jgi:hypothetical protein